jgi:hypothetical protein
MSTALLSPVDAWFILGGSSDPSPTRFRDEFARRALLDGRHYDLVRLVYEFQQTNPGVSDSPSIFRNLLEQYLEDERLLGR